jgi:hypothetical protein
LFHCDFSNLNHNGRTWNLLCHLSWGRGQSAIV